MSRQAQVQRQQKTLRYTITPIGGIEELKKWKLERARIDAEATAKYTNENRENAINVLFTGRELTEEERREIAYATGRKTGKYLSNDVINSVESYLTETPKASFKQKVINFIAQLWKDAFPS